MAFYYANRIYLVRSKIMVWGRVCLLSTRYDNCQYTKNVDFLHVVDGSLHGFHYFCLELPNAYRGILTVNVPLVASLVGSIHWGYYDNCDDNKGPFN